MVAAAFRRVVTLADFAFLQLAIAFNTASFEHFVPFNFYRVAVAFSVGTGGAHV